MTWIGLAAALVIALAYVNVRRQRKAKENIPYVMP